MAKNLPNRDQVCPEEDELHVRFILLINFARCYNMSITIVDVFAQHSFY